MLKNSPRNWIRAHSAIGTSLKIEKSRFVRLGPRRTFHPPFPYVYCRGVAHGAPGTLNDVSNQWVITGLSSSPEPRRSGRLPPAFDTDVASVGVNGNPLCIVRIPFTCQFPNTVLPNGFEMSKRRPFPKGRS